MIEGIITLAGGVLAASGYIISKQSNSQALQAKMEPIQGFLGVLLAGWGLWQVYKCMQVTQLLSIPMFRNHWIFWIICSVTNVVIGIILGLGLLKKSRGGVNSLSKYQVPLGFFAICIGIAFLVLYKGF